MNINIGLASATGSFIEFLEIAVIGYAIARSGYPKEAIWGSIVGIFSISAIALPISRVLETIPLHFLQIAIGLMLIIFGFRWVKKSVRRQVQNTRAAWMSETPLDAEGIILDDRDINFNFLNFWIVTKSAMLETLEIVILVVTLGLASRSWSEVVAGTIAAFLLSIVLVVILNHYLQNVPDVLIKMGAGILLSSLGTFWMGEGLNVEWMFKDATILVILGIYTLITWAIVQWFKYQHRQKMEIAAD